MLEFTPYKTTAAGVKLNLGLLTIPVDLVSAMPDDREDTAFKLGCPLDHGAQAATQVANVLAATFGHSAVAEMPDPSPGRVRQAYLCDHEGHGPFQRHELISIRQVAVAPDEVDDETPEDAVQRILDTKPAEDAPWVSATTEEIVAAKVGTLAKATVDLAVHPAEQVTRSCRPGKKGYLLRPAKTKGEVDPTTEKMYGLLMSLVVDRPDLALVGALRLRDNRAPYRITVFDGQLYLEEVVLPDQIRERDVIDIEVLPSQAKMLVDLAEQLRTDFDPSVHAWDAGAAVAELMAAKTSDTGKKKAAPAPAPTVDFDDLLSMALAAAAPAASAA